MDNIYMSRAIELAKDAALSGEIPVGAVIVRNKQIIAVGQNRRERDQTALGHAEIEAISSACQTLDTWRLDDCDLYVTLEPCPMCAGAIINSRIRRVYFGAYDSKAGSFGSLTDLSVLPFEHRPEIYGGIMELECKQLLTDFFKEIRANADNKHK